MTDTTAPRLNWIAANGPGVTSGTGTVVAGDTVRLSLNFNEVVNVSGSPSLTLNSNGTAKYVSGSGSTTLQFDYKVAKGDNVADLAISGFNLGGVKDKAGNTVNLAGAPQQPAGTLTVNTATAAAVTNTAVNTTTPTAVTSAATNTIAPAITSPPAPSVVPPTPAVAALVGNNNTTLGYTGNTTTPATDGTLASQLALFNQYVASSFGSVATAIGTTPPQLAWGISQTLARPVG